MIVVVMDSGTQFVATREEARRLALGCLMVRGITPHLGGAQWFASFALPGGFGFTLMATDRATLEAAMVSVA